MVVLLARPNAIAQDVNSFTRLTPAPVNQIMPSAVNRQAADLSSDLRSDRLLAQASSPVAQAPATEGEDFRFACEPRQVDVHEFSAGVVSYCRKRDFPVAETDSARVDIEPGSARAPHWHDTWQEQILLSGRAKTMLIDPRGMTHEEVMEPGMIAFLPAGWTHWTETIGEEAASFIFIFPAGFKTFEVGDSVVGLNPEVLRAVVGAELNGGTHNRDALIAHQS
jgi:quercetin dioxygenase-like cupin family protein